MTSPAARALRLALLVAALSASAHAEQAGTPASSPPMRFGMTTSVIEGVSAADARASSALWAEGIAGALGLYHSVEAAVYSTLDEAVRSVSEGRTDLLVLSSPEYIEVEKRLACRPSMAYEIMGEVTQEFVLVAKRQRPPLVPGSASVAVFTQNPKAALAQIWGDTYFHESGIAKGLGAFAAVRPVDRKGRATMAVFFGQADYAIDTRSAFASTVELNP